MNFSYVAFDRAGKSTQGAIEAASEHEARESLRSRGLFVSELTAATVASLAVASSASPLQRLFSGRGRRLRNLVTFTRQLHVLVSSGTPLVQALAALERQTKDEQWRGVIADVRKQVEEGVPLSDAMEKHPLYFDNVCRSLIKAGEAGGLLEAMLERLGKLVRGQLHVRSSITGAMVYPIVLVFISTTVLIILLTFVLPRFALLFQNLGSPLPPTTKVVMAASDVLRGYWWLMLAAGVGAVFGVRRVISTAAGKRTIDAAMIRLPVLGPMVRSFVAARITRLLGIQVESKVPLLDALKLTRQAAGNLYFAELIASAEDAATRGQPVSSAFAASTLISPAISEAIKSGEQSGQLATLLISIADFLDEENDVVIRSLTSIIEPLILVVLGVLVGFVALSMFLPLFDLTSATSGGG